MREKTCRVCERVLTVGESAWADDFKVIDVSGDAVSVRLETRYTCDDCEGTPLADRCNECNLPVPEDDAAPSCGAHILHIDCGPWFGCNHCYLVRAEIP